MTRSARRARRAGVTLSHRNAIVFVDSNFEPDVIVQTYLAPSCLILGAIVDGVVPDGKPEGTVVMVDFDCGAIVSLAESHVETRNCKKKIVKEVLFFSFNKCATIVANSPATSGSLVRHHFVTMSLVRSFATDPWERNTNWK